MGLNILSRDYQARFVDLQRYSGRVSLHLAGLAAAIEDSHPSWRPTVSELLRILPQSKDTNSLVAAGMAYGAAKAIEREFPGPAILLYGAALNAIGSAPNPELEKSISRSEEILDEAGLLEDLDVRATLQAARERASFDRVSQMLRDEFSQGLRASERYPESEIDPLVSEIVKVTHHVRHKGLMERITWQNLEVMIGGSSTDIGFMHQTEEVVFTDDKLRDLLPYAASGCAFSILRRINERRGLSSTLNVKTDGA